MLSRRQPSAPPSSKKTHSQRDTIRPAAPRPTKITFEPLTRPASPSESDEATQSLALNPHKLIPPPPQHPRGFLLRGFSDACLRASPRACVWQASENP